MLHLANLMIFQYYYRYVRGTSYHVTPKQACPFQPLLSWYKPVTKSHTLLQILCIRFYVSFGITNSGVPQIKLSHSEWWSRGTHLSTPLLRISFHSLRWMDLETMVEMRFRPVDRQRLRDSLAFPPPSPPRSWTVFYNLTWVPGVYSYSWPELRAADWYQYASYASQAKRCFGKRICSFFEKKIYSRGGASARRQEAVQK